MEPPYPRIKLCRSRKTDLSIFILRLLTFGMSLAESPSSYLISFCHRISKKKNDSIVMAAYTVRGGEGGVLRISSDRDDRVGAKIKTQKNP